MKNTKKLLGIFLTLVVAVGLVFATSITAEASYSYRIKVSLGNNEHASFNQSYIDSLGYETSFADDGTGGRTLEIDKLAYGDVVDLDLDSLVKIEASSKDTTYYVKGLKSAGADADKPGKKHPTIKVDEDATYVISYGVGATVPYTVRYVDQSGNKLEADEILYGAVGEVLVVPARFVPGYRPEHMYLTNEKAGGLLKGELKTDAEGHDYVENGTVFTFKYNTYDGKVIYSDTYAYQTVYDEQNLSGNEGGATVIDRRTGGGNAGQAGGGNAGGNPGGNDAAADAGAGDEGQTITEPETPLDIVDIDDEETAKAGGAKERFARNMILAIIIAIVAVATVLVALIIADRKRKAQEAVNSHDDHDEF